MREFNLAIRGENRLLVEIRLLETDPGVWAVKAGVLHEEGTRMFERVLRVTILEGEVNSLGLFFEALSTLPAEAFLGDKLPPEMDKKASNSWVPKMIKELLP